MKIKIKDLKKGDLFTLNEKEGATIYIRGEYERSCHRYSVTKYEDVNEERFFKGEKVVYSDEL